MLVSPNTGGFGLWVEQLLAESTGKQGKGLVPSCSRPTATTSSGRRCACRTRTSSGQEFFRWEFATAVAGSILGINPFDQPDVQAAKDKTNEVLVAGEAPLEPQGLAGRGARRCPRRARTTSPFWRSSTRPGERELEPLVARARATGCAVTVGLGPRYLHSTGQLHKGGPDRGVFVQVVDDLGEELPIPGREFGFRRLIAAQAAGDYEALEERGRRIVRVRLEDVA